MTDRLLAIALALVPLGLAGCSTRAGANAVGPLPPPVSGTSLSSYAPANPLEQVVPGVVGRTLARTPASNGFHVEAREFIVGPGPRRVDLALKAAGIFEVTSGSATLSIGNDRRQLVPGSTFSVPDDQGLSIDNMASAALYLRAYLFVPE